MRPSDSIASKQSKGESPKLTAALAFGFAAGALFSRKPAAAIAAVATGLIACASSRRSKSDDALVMPQEETPPAPVVESVPEIAVIEETTPPQPLVETVEFSPLDPLPEFGDCAESADITEADDLASLSLPELDSSSPDQPVITPVVTHHDASIVKPRAQSPAPEVSHLPGKLTIALVPGIAPPAKSRPVAAKKKSWMSWWQ